MTADVWEVDEEDDGVRDPWLRPDWEPLRVGEVAALAGLVRAAIDAAAPADRLLLAAAWRTGRSSLRFAYPISYDPNDDGRVDVVASLGGVDVVRVGRGELGGWTRW